MIRFHWNKDPRTDQSRVKYMCPICGLESGEWKKGAGPPTEYSDRYFLVLPWGEVWDNLCWDCRWADKYTANRKESLRHANARASFICIRWLVRHGSKDIGKKKCKGI